MKQKVLFLMLLLLLGLAGGSVMAGEPVVERQAGMKIKPGNGIRPARLDRKELARQKGMRLDGKELDRMEKMPLKEASAGMKQRKDAPKRQAPPLIKEQPEGELTTYWRSGGCISGSSWYEQKGKLDVVIDGTDAYIKNPSWYEDSYNTWVSGTYDAETGIISIPTGQYLYWNETKGYGIQMMWGSTSGYKNEGSESYSLKAELDENVTEILFQIDEEAETITLLDSEGNLKADLPDKYNATGIYLMWDDDKSFAAIEFNTKGEVLHVVPAVPANPTADDWYDCGNENGYSRFYFTLPTTDVDGNALDPEKLSYSIYVDGKLFTFDAAHYTYDIEEDMTDIPYSIYNSSYDFYVGAVYFYRTNEGDNPLFTNRIGIQVHYTVDGVKNSSDIVYWDLPTDPAIPANPTADSWNDSGDESGYTRFGFTLPTKDVDGNPIDPSKLSYSIYTDNDQLFTFDAGTYSEDLTEDMTEIPYSIFNGGWDFYKGAVFFYRTNAEGYTPLFTKRIGIQVHYTMAGVKNSSDIVYWYLPGVPANPTGVNWYDEGDESGLSKFSFTLPAKDMNGNELNKENLSYSIYTDEDQIFTFSGSDYTFDLEEDEEITEVPYDLYSDAVDFKNYFVYLYRTNEGGNPLFTNKIGIQVHYTVDGVKNSSEIVYLYPLPADAVNFVNNKDNSDLVTENADKKADATIDGRTLYTDGRWNTLCLPFDLTAEQLESSLIGFEIKELDTEASESYTHITGYEAETKTLWLNFKNAEEIKAGKPYIVKYIAYATENITNPVFENVIIKDISPIEVTSKDKTVTFVGTYAPVVYEEENKSVLFLQGEKLYYPDGKAPTTINSFRAYFPLNGIYGGTPEEASGVHNFVLNFGDGETTGITTTKLTNQNVDWYSIDGRKLNQKPQQRGIYISNGRKVMVK